MNGKKMWYIHKVPFSFKTEEHPATCYSKDESQDIALSEISQAQKENGTRSHLYVDSKTVEFIG